MGYSVIIFVHFKIFPIFLTISWDLFLFFLLLFGFFFFCLFVSFFFLGQHAQHMEVPRLGGEIRATADDLRCSHGNIGSEQLTSVVYATYTTAQSNAGSPTHWLRLGMEPASSRILVRFISAVPQWQLHSGFFKTFFFILSFTMLILPLFLPCGSFYGNNIHQSLPFLLDFES